VSYEGRYFTIGAAKGNALVDSSGEVRDPVFKVLGDLDHI